LGTERDEAEATVFETDIGSEDDFELAKLDKWFKFAESSEGETRFG
jgi:hypothetical protein